MQRRREGALALTAILVAAGCATSGAGTWSGDRFSDLDCPAGTRHAQEGLTESCRNPAGQLEGRVIDWEAPGVKSAEGEYHGGLRDGRFVLWYRSGVKAWERTYARGQLVHEQTYFANGRPFVAPGPARLAFDEPDPTRAEGFPREVIHRVMETRNDSIRRCYQRALVETPGLTGTMAVRFTIGPEGKVEEPDLASSTVENSPLEECVIRLIARLEFPRPRSGGVIRVRYPFVFPAS